MNKINVGRWIVGGVVAGIVIFVVDWVLNGIILMDQWNQAMSDLGKPPMGQTAGEIIAFVIFDLLMGLAAVWVYVGIRPRFGAGPTTAVYAGLTAWVLVSALPGLFMLSVGVFPATLVWTTTVVGVVQLVVATVIGAYFYQEETA
jgi:hypothetical protein